MPSMPEYFYRYRSASSSYFEDEISRAFERSEIYCTQVSWQNDPFDSRPVMVESALKDVNKYLKAANGRESIVTEESLAKFYPDPIERKKAKKKLRPGPLAAKTLIKSIKDQTRGFRDRAKIACMSERWDSMLMWSHYTGSHEGVCIEYSLAPWRPDEKSQVPHMVRYVTDRAVISTLDMIALIKRDKIEDPAVQLRAEKCLNAIILEKSEDWKYEHEWRVASFDDAPNGYFKFSPLKATGVILGANSSEDTKEMLDGLLPPSATLSKIKLNESSYRLERVEIDRHRGI